MPLSEAKIRIGMRPRRGTRMRLLISAKVENMRHRVEWLKSHSALSLPSVFVPASWWRCDGDSVALPPPKLPDAL